MSTHLRRVPPRASRPWGTACDLATGPLGPTQDDRAQVRG